MTRREFSLRVLGGQPARALVCDELRQNRTQLLKLAALLACFAVSLAFVVNSERRAVHKAPTAAVAALPAINQPISHSPSAKVSLRRRAATAIKRVSRAARAPAKHPFEVTTVAPLPAPAKEHGEALQPVALQPLGQLADPGILGSMRHSCEIAYHACLSLFADEFSLVSEPVLREASRVKLSALVARFETLGSRPAFADFENPLFEGPPGGYSWSMIAAAASFFGVIVLCLAAPLYASYKGAWLRRHVFQARH